MALDHGDYEQFFEHQYDTVQRAVTFITGDQHRAEEAVQEAFARALRRWRTVSTLERPATWVYVVALRDHRRRFRREQSETPEGEHAPIVVGGPDPVVDRLWLHQAILQLSPRQRMAIVLRYFADLELNEVGRAMGCATGTVKATLHAALARLRLSMSEEDEEVSLRRDD